MTDINSNGVSAKNGVSAAEKNGVNGVAKSAVPMVVPPSAPRQNSAMAILDAIYTFVTFVLFYVLVPFFLPLSLMFRIHRHRTQKKVLERSSEAVTIMGSNDAMYQSDTEENRMVIIGLMKATGLLDIKAFQQRTVERVLEARNDYGEKSFPKLTQYSNQLLHRDVWMEDKDFRIEDHVFEYPEKAPADKHDMQEMFGEISSRPLPAWKSPWQMICFRTEKDENSFYVILKVHHTVGDGVSLVRVITQYLTDRSPEVSPVNKRFGTKKSAMKFAKLLYEGPGVLLKRLMWPMDDTVLHGRYLSGHKHLAWSNRIDLDLVKRIKNATGTTVNDVLVSCLAGAFRNFFKKHQSSMPKNISAYIPIDIRPANSKMVLDNQFSLVFLSLPLDREDSLETLVETRDRMSAIKSSPEPIANHLLMSYGMARLPKWMASVFFSWIANKASMVLSNVPGPSTPLTLLGNQIDDLMFWPPARSSVGLGISIFSYNGGVRIGVMSDRNTLTNPDVLVQEFVKKINDLAAELKVL